MSQRRFAVVLASLLLTAGAAQAQVSDEILQATSGDWLLAPEDGRPGCRVQLKTAETIGGYELEKSPECDGVREALKNAVAWRFDESNNGIAFSDPERKTVLSFAEKEDATYATDGEAGEALLLLKAALGVTAVPNARDIFGTWTVQKSSGGNLCRITFAEEPPPGGEESYGLKLEDGCDAALTALKLASWRTEGLNLMLYGTEGESVSFEPNGTNSFLAAEAKPPMKLVKPDAR